MRMIDMSRLFLAALLVAVAPAQLQAAPNTTCTTENGNYSVKQGDKNYSCKSKETCTTTEYKCKPIGDQIRCGNETKTTTSYDNCTVVQASGPGAGGIVPGTMPDVLAPDTSTPPSRRPGGIRPGGVLQGN
jgi:hypothetical protein